MTTNKPEVVAYRHVNKEHPTLRGVSLFQDPSCYNELVEVEALIRLSDYEALQAECEKLRKDAERYRRLRIGDINDIAVVRGLGAMDYGMSAVIDTYSEEIDGDVLDAAIDAAMEKENKT